MSIKHLLKDFFWFPDLLATLLTLLGRTVKCLPFALKRVSCLCLSPGSVLYHW